MTIFHYIGIAVFVLFCIAMIWMINEDMEDTQRSILHGYGFSNAVESSRTFERTGISLDSEIPYLADDVYSGKHSTPTKNNSCLQQDSKFYFEL